MVNVYKGMADALTCGSYKDIKLLEHAMKFLERVIEGRLRKIVRIDSMQFGFMAGRSTTDAIFIVRLLQEFVTGKGAKIIKNSVTYLMDVESVVRSFGFAVQLYADDTQLYGSSLPMDAEDLSVRVLEAISAVESWMSSNRLRLNADKTQFSWFGTHQQLAKRDLASLASISPSLISSDSVRDLGVLLDSELTMDAHIKQLCRSCFYQLRRLRVIRHCLSRESLLTLAYAFICNRIDYCNGVLCGVTAGRLDRLQSVLNATARLVLNIPKFSHISLAIRDELHWLPVQCRSQYKTVSLCETAFPVLRHNIYRNSAALSPPCWVVSIFDLLAETTS